MVIVLVIIGIILGSLQSFFQTNKRDESYAETCIQNTFAQIKGFLEGVAAGKGVQSWFALIFPDISTISFQPWQQKITLGYSTGSQYLPIKSFNFSGTDVDTATYCSRPSYRLELSWQSYDLLIRKQLLGDINQPPFILSGNNTSITGESIRYYCWPTFPCKEFFKIRADKRSQDLKLIKCFTANSSWACLKRSDTF